MIIIIHLNTQLHILKAAYAVKIPHNECKRNVLYDVKRLHNMIVQTKGYLLAFYK